MAAGNSGGSATSRGNQAIPELVHLDEDEANFAARCSELERMPWAAAVLATVPDTNRDLVLELPTTIHGRTDAWAATMAQRTLCVLDQLASQLKWPRGLDFDPEAREWQSLAPPFELQRSVRIRLRFGKLSLLHAFHIARAVYRVIMLVEYKNPYIPRYLTRRYHLLLGKVDIEDAPPFARTFYALLRPLIGARTRNLIGFET